MDTIFGIPAHPLIVHGVVVLVPLVAVGAIAAMVSPWVRAHIGWLVAAGAALNVILVPLATGSGESLEEKVDETALVEAHTEMGEQLTVWVIVLAIALIASMLVALLVSRRSAASSTPIWASRWVGLTLAAVTIIASCGALVQVARIGHSGAKATWSDASAAIQPTGNNAIPR